MVESELDGLGWVLHTTEYRRQKQIKLFIYIERLKGEIYGTDYIINKRRKKISFS